MALQVTKIIEVTRLANALLLEHGLLQRGWCFNLDQPKQRVGQCNYERKVISYSLYFLAESSDDEIKDTILHEIAHALVGPNHGHDATWRSKCIEIGAKPERLASEEVVTTAIYNYKLICPVCAYVWNRYRLRQSLYGSKCEACQVKLEIYALNPTRRLY